ncbi:MAG TPA: carboxypeptidase regulatory-like domain-containing protein, partial [Planctomycetota bacterium]|nr:carboxypeptidase regulatory-like domain-containing protein [Planctomycetota bacterium]
MRSRCIGALALALAAAAVAVSVDGGASPKSLASGEQPDASAVGADVPLPLVGTVRGGDESATTADEAPRDQALPAEAGTLVVLGRVVDSEHRPIAGARVRLREVWPSRLLARTETCADGEFAIGVATHGPYSGRLEIDAGRRETVVVGPIELLQARTNLGDVVLDAAAELIGRVTGPKGEPVAGARVYLRSPNVEAPADFEKRVRAVTGADGRFRATDVVPGWVELGVAARGYADHVLPNLRLEAGATTERSVALEPEVVYAGRVVDADGQPVAGAKVGAWAPRGFWRAWAESDVLGRVRIAGLARECRSTPPRAWKPGWRGGDRATHDDEPEQRWVLERNDVRLVLVARRETRGAPPVIEYVDVRAIGIRSEAEPDGRHLLFRTDRIDRERWELDVSGRIAEARMRATVKFADGTPPATVEFDTPRSADPAVVTVVARDGCRISGRVYARAAGLRAGVRVVLSPERGRHSLQATLTNESGEFVFENVAPGTVEIAVDSARACSLPERVVIAPDDVDRSVDVFAVGSATIRGRITGARGRDEPLLVEVARVLDGDGEEAPVAVGTALPAEDGTFVIAPAPIGRVRVTACVRADQLGSDALRASSVEDRSASVVVIVSPESEHDVALAMPPVSRCAIEGVVRVNGRPAAGVGVDLIRAGVAPEEARTEASAETDADGRFAAKAAHAGDVRVVAHVREHDVEETVHVSGVATAEVALDLEVGDVSGQIEGTPGSREESSVWLERAGEGGGFEQCREASVSPRGAFEFFDVPAGTYRAVVVDRSRTFGVAFTSPFAVHAGTMRLPAIAPPPSS